MFIDMWYRLTGFQWEQSAACPNTYTAYEWVDPDDHSEGYAFVMGVVHGPSPAYVRPARPEWDGPAFA